MGKVHHSLCRARTRMALTRAIRKISWHLRLVRADSEKERAFLDLDQDQIKDLISDMLRGDMDAQYHVPEQGSADSQKSLTLVRMGTKRKARSLEGSVPA